MSCLGSNLRSICIIIVKSKCKLIKNTGKSKVLALLKVLQNVSDQSIKLNGFDLKNKNIKTNATL